ncbi:xanthine dehydrogenase accessory factor [Aequitasia blattaphilus]|uniref:Xanthine dehydrogenase accessory protein XdhC n=1 Tax=Aequitasia blattaphilus TaxID=2949332 RepID=A0ABT1E8I8_9FIRM|nr:xanthine dehydrogenase accessory protein XdhC [Aequitasia blattaphilus]MCP1102093.1 xanthine dehydrogenase accessory protein XdhC [Aequitasia blattaphilus]MCR8614733.1 xanthine dehydrogenase accessory protein XdhC [Aequitasia blattaphilus]
MRELFQKAKEYIEKKEDIVVVTIVSSSGSTPRGTGAKMLVTKEGRSLGTIGGGMVELMSEEEAKKALLRKESQLLSYQLKKNEIQDLGMICGGDVTIYLKYIPGGNQDFLELCKGIDEVYEKNKKAWLVAETAESSKGEWKLVPDTEDLKQYSNHYIEEIKAPEKVYIFGGGHVSQALVPVLASVEFQCIVLEDREEFTKRELFPGVCQTIRTDNHQILGGVTIQQEDYVVIMTRGHKDDERIMEQILKTPAKYIGVIGSRKKKAGVFERLKKKGFTEQDFERITTPIGLAIGAKTPAEIAISIVAQMIQIRGQE